MTFAPGDATRLALGRRFDLVLAPASFIQIVDGRVARQALLGVVARHLAANGVAVVAIADVDEILRECATPAPPQRLHAEGRTFTAQQLAATAVEGGARVSWEYSAPGEAAQTAGLTIHRLSAEDVEADAHVHGLQLSRVHHDPGDAATLGSRYCVLHHAEAVTPGSSPSARRTPRR